MKNFNFKFAVKRAVVLIFIISTAATFRSSGQNPNLERLKAYKIGFITKRLNLTPKEAETFWPVYNEFEVARNDIQKQRMTITRNIQQNAPNMNEKDLADAGDKFISLQMDEAKLAIEYHKKFKEILPPEKVLRLYQAENQYRVQLLNELKERRPGPAARR